MQEEIKVLEKSEGIMQNKYIELKEEVYERVATLLSLEDISNLTEYTGFKVSKDYYEQLAEVIFDNNMICHIVLVSSTSSYWIEVYFTHNNDGEHYRYYSLDKVLHIEEQGIQYNIVIAKHNEKYNIASYCWSNNPEDSFDETWEDNCQEGDLLFNVPKGWLLNEIIDKPDDYSMYYNFKDKLIELTFDKLLEDWDNCYTHDEGYKLFCEGIEQNVVSDIIITHCNHCLKYNI